MGAVGRFHRGPPHRRGDPEGRRRPVSQAAQHLPLSARRARRVQRGGAARRCRGICPSSSATCSRWPPSSTQQLRKAVDDFDFNDYVRALTDFCNDDLSAFYFDIRKDCLYCDAPTRSRSAAPIAPCSTPCSTRWCAGWRRCWCSPPRKCGARAFRTAGQVHLLEWPEMPDGRGRLMPTGPSCARFATQVTEAIEPLRRDKVVGSSLEAEVTVPSDRRSGLPRRIVHHLDSDERRCLSVAKTDNHKCGRCWRHFPEVDERRRAVRPLRGGGRGRLMLSYTHWFVHGGPMIFTNPTRPRKRQQRPAQPGGQTPSSPRTLGTFTRGWDGADHNQ